MSAQLDELDQSSVMTEGLDTHVIAKKLKVELDGMDKFVNVALWCLLVIPGLVYQFKKAKAETYFQQLQQKIQHDASTIDNYMAQRASILQNAAKLLEKSIDLDKSTFVDLAKARSGVADVDEARNEMQTQLNNIERSINVVLERYPELKAHQDIAAVMQQNSYLQQEITAAREVYNDTIQSWNAQIFSRWAKKAAAAKAGYTTRIPFTASSAVKEQAEGLFF
ncbi:MAG: LemA family protein [Bacilli bacterium]|nr:LemA family protein [Bacilli bacterium]